MTLIVNELGMSFGRMDESEEERVRFLDDIDVTLAYDTSSNGAQQDTSIELALQKVVFRASATNIFLLMDIVNKAIALAAAGTTRQPDPAQTETDNTARRKSIGTSKASATAVTGRRSSMTTKKGKSLPAQAQVIMTRETVSRHPDLVDKNQIY